MAEPTITEVGRLSRTGYTRHIVVIGDDVTDDIRLPEGTTLDAGQRVVSIPRDALIEYLEKRHG